jgi:hypothetical protein
MCNLLMIFTLTYYIKIHIVLIFNHCLSHHCGLHILFQMHINVQLKDEWIRFKGNSLIYITIWMLKRGIN